MRKSGVLLSVTSLPSPYGIGSMGTEAYRFVDRLKRSGQRIWQILPLGPTSYGDSPYQSFSVFAGNPYLIDLDILCEEGLLSKEECEKEKVSPKQKEIDYGHLYQTRYKILKKAYQRADLGTDKDYQQFLKENAEWVEDYALFMAIKDSLDGVSLAHWPVDLRKREPGAVAEFRERLCEEQQFYTFLQYCFFKQWFALKAYANKAGIEIVGDIPIYVAYDSADVWTNPGLFELDEELMPIRVAGCPPDAFSKDGQLWGNPLYDWKRHKQEQYAWWIKRMRAALELYDVVRIDHFRGFDSYYAIPYGSINARNGRWVTGPGYDLFMTMERVLGKMNIIAEDLGFITDSVKELLARTGYPGMKILQFAFDAREESDSLPHHYCKNSVVYTGTHDNNTVLGWYQECAKEDLCFAMEYFNIKKPEQLPEAMIRCCLASVADTVIIPMQDYLELGEEARMNTPSTLGCNWKWQMEEDAFTKEVEERMKKWIRLYAR